jgi:hypothetical protein
MPSVLSTLCGKQFCWTPNGLMETHVVIERYYNLWCESEFYFEISGVLQLEAQRMLNYLNSVGFPPVFRYHWMQCQENFRMGGELFTLARNYLDTANALVDTANALVENSEPSFLKVHPENIDIPPLRSATEIVENDGDGMKEMVNFLVDFVNSGEGNPCDHHVVIDVGEEEEKCHNEYDKPPSIDFEGMVSSLLDDREERDIEQMVHFLVDFVNSGGQSPDIENQLDVV